MRRAAVAFLAATVLGGCVSIATYEEAMRRCRSVGMRADEMTARIADLEAQLAQLKSSGDIAQGDVAVEDVEGSLTITLSDKVLFRSGEWDLHERGEKVLRPIAEVLKKVGDRLYRVEGHTDNVPISDSLRDRFPSNWELSAARAAAVVRYLDERGVDGGRLVAAAFGDRRPVADNGTAKGRGQNRRVQISLEPLPEAGPK